MSRSKFELRYCEELVKHMMLGHSYVTIGAKLGVAPTTLFKWEDKYPEWKEAKELGMVCCQYTWEEILLSASKGEVKTAPAALIFALKNYFPEQFKDNQQLGTDNGVTLIFESGVPRKLDVDTTAEEVNEVKSIESNKAVDVEATDIPYESAILDDSELL